MIRYRCQACGAAMMSTALEAGTLEHCPKCGKGNVVPDPPPAPPAGKTASPGGRPGARSIVLTAAVFGGLGIGAGLLIALAVPRGGGPLATRDAAPAPPADIPGSSATRDSRSQEAQAEPWAKLRARLEKDLELARQAASRTQRDLASLLADGNFAYLPSVLPADANEFRQLNGIRRLAVLSTGSEGMEAALGVRDLRPALETALGAAGFTIDSSRPDAIVLCHVSLVPLQESSESDALTYCLVECGVSRQVFIPKARCTSAAVVWMTSAVGMAGSEDIPRSIGSPKDAVNKATAELINALTKGKGP